MKPLVALMLLLTAGCGTATTTETTPSTTPTAPSTTRASEPALPASYTAVVTSSCGERPFLGRFRLMVRDGGLVSITALRPTDGVTPGPGDVPTLAELVAKAADAGPRAEVELETDDRGLPTRLSIDHVPQAVDDEECYAVSDLVVD